jgi:hypothetical protein
MYIKNRSLWPCNKGIKYSLHPTRISCSGINIHFKLQFGVMSVITLVWVFLQYNIINRYYRVNLQYFIKLFMIKKCPDLSQPTSITTILILYSYTSRGCRTSYLIQRQKNWLNVIENRVPKGHFDVRSKLKIMLFYCPPKMIMVKFRSVRWPDVMHSQGIREMRTGIWRETQHVDEDLDDLSTDGMMINPLKTKRRLLYLKTQFVQRSKHFSSRL